MRDHTPIPLEEFNGLWKRGEADSCPADHFTDGENVQFFQHGFRTRDGLDTYAAIANPVRMYNYKMQEQESLLILDSSGDIYHRIDATTVHGPILSIPEMTDFGMVAIAGRAYITPFATFQDINGINYQKGLEDDFVYVYLGDGTNARKAAGDGPTAGSLTLADGGAGNVQEGVHVFAVAYETDTGFITQIARFNAITVASGGRTVAISNIPVSPDTFVVARRLVATIAIPTTLYTGNEEGYQFFYIPDGRIDNNTATTLNVSFFDSELLSDASHLLDLLNEIPAGVGLTTYHERMLVWASFDDISLIRISYPGEPEAMDAVSGLIVIPLDGKPITICQEYRDILYAFKNTRTFSVSDNGDVPSAWPVEVVDQGIGASVHGIATVLDSGGVNIDYLIIVDWSGLMVFNGGYTRPELSFKIKDLWDDIDRNDFGNIQTLNDSISLRVYIALPDRLLLYGDYSEGFNPKSIKWMIWRFDIETTTIALVETDKLLIGAFQLSS